MYTVIFKLDGEWHLCNLTSVMPEYLEEDISYWSKKENWEDWRIERYDIDFKWHEIGGLVVDANKGDEQAAMILGIDDDWWYERNKKLIH